MDGLVVSPLQFFKGFPLKPLDVQRSQTLISSLLPKNTNMSLQICFYSCF